MNRAKHQRHLRAALAVILLSTAASASAEPIKLVTGGLFYSRQNAAMFDAESLSGLRVRIEFGDSEAWNPDHACFGCTPGTRITLSQSESFPNETSDTIWAGGSVWIDGVNYWLDSMSLRINAGHATIPDTSGDRSQSVDAGRFVFHSVITGTSDSGITRTFRFHGKGNVSILFGNNDWFGTSYRLSDPAAAAPVPEPGTMLLVGGGALAALARRRKPRSAAA